MEDILLAVTVIAFSVFGLYMASHLDRFIDRICLSFQRPQEPEGRICITGTKEKSIETIDPGSSNTLKKPDSMSDLNHDRRKRPQSVV